MTKLDAIHGFISVTGVEKRITINETCTNSPKKYKTIIFQ